MLRCRKLLETLVYAKFIVNTPPGSCYTRSSYITKQCQSNPHNVMQTRKFTQFTGYNYLRHQCTATRLLQQKSGLQLSEVQAAIYCRLFHTSTSPLFSGQQNQKKTDEEEDEEQFNNRRNVALLLIFAFTCLPIPILMYLWNQGGDMEQDQVVREVTWKYFVNNMLTAGEVKSLQINTMNNVVYIHLHDGAIVNGKTVPYEICYMKMNNLKNFEDKLLKEETRLGIPPSERLSVESTKKGRMLDFLYRTNVLALLLFLLGWRMMRKSPMNGLQMNFMQKQFKIILPNSSMPGDSVKLSDVIGAEEAKLEVLEFVNFISDPEKYKTLGAKAPKGAIMLGPPGCGKTLLAKAVARDCNIPFIVTNGSEFIELVRGVGAQRIRQLFKTAHSEKPCIIYIDEIDTIGGKRQGTQGHGGNSEAEQTLNQLLVEMDGIGSEVGVIVLASTNRLNVLDPALLRPGRFDRHILLGLPTQDDRQKLFEHYLKSITLEKSPEFYSRRLAALSLGFTGADIANIANEAALHAARHAGKVVTLKDLDYAIDRVVCGAEKKSQAVSKYERRIVAFHESGHTLVGWLLEHTNALLKVTIIPRTNHSLGLTQTKQNEQKLYSKEEMFQFMCVGLGGRVAESLTFNQVTSGAQKDLTQVTKMAYAQVKIYGFSDVVGHVSYSDPDDQTYKRPYSNRLQTIMDDEASRLIFSAYKATEEILNKNTDKLKMLAEALLQKESLTYEDVEALIGPPPFGKKNLIEQIQFEGEINSWTNVDPPKQPPPKENDEAAN